MALEGATSHATGGSRPNAGIDIRACFYCGVPADSIDHVVPRSLLRDLSDDPQAKALLTARGRILEVDACRQCNSLLGSDYDQTLAERKARLRLRLRQRYARLLDTPDWTDSELGRMGQYLQNHILTHSAMRDWVRDRLAYDGPATRRGVRQHALVRVSLGRNKHVTLEQGLELLLLKAEQMATRRAA